MIQLPETGLKVKHAMWMFLRRHLHLPILEHELHLLAVVHEDGGYLRTQCAGVGFVCVSSGTM